MQILRSLGAAVLIVTLASSAALAASTESAEQSTTLKARPNEELQVLRPAASEDNQPVQVAPGTCGKGVCVTPAQFMPLDPMDGLRVAPGACTRSNCAKPGQASPLYPIEGQRVAPTSPPNRCTAASQCSAARPADVPLWVAPNCGSCSRPTPVAYIGETEKNKTGGTRLPVA